MDVFQLQRMLAISEEEQEPTHFKSVSAAKHAAPLVPEPCGLHHGKIWHVHVCFRHA